MKYKKLQVTYTVPLMELLLRSEAVFDVFGSF